MHPKPRSNPLRPRPLSTPRGVSHQAGQGQVALILPANPAETSVAPPISQARAGPPAATVSYRTLPSSFQANRDAGVHESGWPFVIVGDRDGAPMVLVPGGTFSMGTSEGQPVESPPHQVRLSSYYIDQHEVTNRQFRVFLGESHYRGQPPGKWLTDDKNSGRTRECARRSCQFPRRRIVCDLGQQKTPHRGTMGNGRAIDRWSKVSLGRRGGQMVPAADVPPARSNHVVPGRQVALRHFRHGGQCP